MEQQKKSPNTDTLVEDLGESIGYIQAFVGQEIDAVKLEIAEKLSIASSALITGLVLGTFSTLVVIFAAIAFALFLGNWLGSNALGFLLVAALFLLLFFAVYFFRKPLVTDQIVEAVIHLFFDKAEDETNS